MVDTWLCGCRCTIGTYDSSKAYVVRELGMRDSAAAHVLCSMASGVATALAGTLAPHRAPPRARRRRPSAAARAVNPRLLHTPRRHPGGRAQDSGERTDTCHHTSAHHAARRLVACRPPPRPSTAPRDAFPLCSRQLFHPCTTPLRAEPAPVFAWRASFFKIHRQKGGEAETERGRDSEAVRAVCYGPCGG